MARSNDTPSEPITALGEDWRIIESLLGIPVQRDR